MIVQRKYATGTGADLIIPIYKAGATDFAVSADWTPAAGDVKVSKDGGAAANIATLPTFVANIGWKFVFSDAELTCARLNVNVVDSATKAIEDQHIIIETYGNASAQHAFDLNTATQGVNVTQISGDSAAADNLEADYDGTGYAKANSTIGTTTTNTDMRGTDSAALATVCSEARLAELDAANLPADVGAILLDTGTDGVVLAADAITAAKIADNAIAAEHLAATGLAKIAAWVWRTSYNTLRTASYTGLPALAFRSAIGALARLVNKNDASDGANWKTYHEDDATLFETTAITTDATADAITVSDPS